MKLLIAIISRDDVDEVCKALSKARIMASHVASSRSFLDPGTATLMIGTKDEQVKEALDLLKEHAGVHRRRTESYDSLPSVSEEGGGAVFVIDAEQFVIL